MIINLQEMIKINFIKQYFLELILFNNLFSIFTLFEIFIIFLMFFPLLNLELIFSLIIIYYNIRIYILNYN